VRWEPTVEAARPGGDGALRRARIRSDDVADIAERAGLTERTFFRHFSDKREVLFPGHSTQDLLVTTIVGAPVSTTPSTR